jgi:hypothetical protein
MQERSRVVQWGMRRLLAPVLVLLAVFTATYIAALALGSSVSLAVVVTVAAAFLWIVARDVRRTSWAESQRAQDAAYAATAIAALHTPGQSGSDCPTGFDGGFSGGDCGAGGI